MAEENTLQKTGAAGLVNRALERLARRFGVPLRVYGDGLLEVSVYRLGQAELSGRQERLDNADQRAKWHIGQLDGKERQRAGPLEWIREVQLAPRLNGCLT